MEIRIIIDDRIVRGVRRVLARPVLALAAGALTLLGGIGVVRGVDQLTTFVPNTPISATEVNANFTTLRDAVQTLEEKPTPFASCTTNYAGPCMPAVDCIASCPVGQVPISGGCDTAGGGLVMESYPTRANATIVQNGSLMELSRWVCKTDAGTVWPFVVCCTL